MNMDLLQLSGSSRQIASCIIASLPVFMAGVVLGWPSPIMEYMSAGSAPVSLTSSQMSLMVVCIDIGNFAMAIPAGWLMDRMGRKFAVNMSTPLMIAGWIFIFFSRQAWSLYVARLLQGAAVGIGWVVAPAYVGEMASVHLRGLLGLMVQLSYSTGLLFSYAAGWLLDGYAALTAASASATIVCGTLLLFLPESPYYLMLDGRPDDAAKCLWTLRTYTDDEFQSELVTVKSSMLNERCKWKIGDLLNRDRRPLLIVMVFAVLQMSCGASVLEAYAASILSDTEISANALAVVLGLIILLAAVPFAIAVDRWGRRPLMIVSCFGTAACLAALAYCLSSLSDGGWFLKFGSMAGAQFFINIGIMPMLSVIQCEYFPSDTRALADTVVVLTVTLTSTIDITSYQLVADAFGQAVDFAAFAAISFAGGVFCYVYMPETKCKSFADIQTEFHRKKLKQVKNGDAYEQLI